MVGSGGTDADVGADYLPAVQTVRECGAVFLRTDTSREAASAVFSVTGHFLRR